MSSTNWTKMKNRVSELRSVISTLQREITEIQDACEHPAAARTYTQRTLYPNTSQQLVDYHCEVCDKKWPEFIEITPK